MKLRRKTYLGEADIRELNKSSARSFLAIAIAVFSVCAYWMLKYWNDDLMFLYGSEMTFFFIVIMVPTYLEYVKMNKI